MAWIWLDENIYPEFSENFSNTGAIGEKEQKLFPFCAAQFSKEYKLNKTVIRAELNVSADNMFQLFVNGSFSGLGPVLPGGDFLCRRPAPKHYFNSYNVDVNSDTVKINAMVRLLPQKVCDYSRNHGGFMLEGKLIFEDGSEEPIVTNSSWLCRRDAAYNDFCSYDSTLAKSDFCFSSEIPDRWNAEKALIPMLSFEKVHSSKLKINPGEKREFLYNLEKIWAAYPIVKSSGKCNIELVTSELEGQNTTEEDIRFGEAGEYFSFRMHSVGFVKITVENDGEDICEIDFSLLASFYPDETPGSFKCSDAELNNVYDVCRHTLKICRQTIHLDSPQHQELLACTGDYYIDSLMSFYMFGDMKLAEFDLIRTADWLSTNCGRMFHTTYSLIWVQMLHDTYMITGNDELLQKCLSGLDALFNRFDSYMGTSGVIEYPPDFMFVDWTVVDGYSMHHPPKALGQTVLNAFYYEALKKGAEIYAYAGKEAKSLELKNKMPEFRKCFNREFFDSEKGLYFDGKNDMYGGFENYIPANSQSRYYTKYPNILACAYGLIEGDEAVKLLESIIFNDAMQDIQPYFMHYMFCAVRKLGLFEKYGMKLCERWKPVVAECDKGLKEGWIAPQPDYSFDHSHSWGGTVGYQLPSALSGLKILEPGMKKISLSPNLYGLKTADIVIPTKAGEIRISLNEGDEPRIIVPEGIQVHVNP